MMNDVPRNDPPGLGQDPEWPFWGQAPRRRGLLLLGAILAFWMHPERQLEANAPPQARRDA